MRTINQLKGNAKANHYISSICIHFPGEKYSVSSDFAPSSNKHYYDADFLESIEHIKDPANRVYRRTLNNSEHSKVL